MRKSQLRKLLRDVVVAANRLAEANEAIAAEIDRRGAETWICEECRAPWAMRQPDSRGA